MIRVAQGWSDNLFNSIMTRRNLATLSQGIVDSLARACKRTIEQYHGIGFGSTATHQDTYALWRAGSAMECLSRLVLRMEAKQVIEVMRLAISCYRTQTFYDELFLREAIRHMLTRSFEALPEDNKQDFILELLSLPIAGFDGFLPNAYAFVDPGELIDGQEALLPKREENNEDLWSSAIQFLIRALEGEIETRDRAMLRLAPITMAGRLSESEKDAFGRAIWRVRNESEVHPLGEDRLWSWVYFCLPQPEPNIAMNWFRQKWLSPWDSSVDQFGIFLDQALFAIGDAKENAGMRDFEFDLSADDELFIVEQLRRWTRIVIPKRLLVADFGGSRVANANNAVRGIAILLMFVDVPSEVIGNLLSKCRYLDEVGIPSLLLRTSLSRLDPDIREQVITEIHNKLLVAKHRKAVVDATTALQGWLYFASLGLIDAPTENLIRDIGLSVESLRGTSLDRVLLLIEWIYMEGDERHKKLLEVPMKEGLKALIPVLSYENMGDVEDDFDVPLLRWRCVRIARILKNSGFKEEPVSTWLEIAANDPLPEARRSIPGFTQ